MPRLGSTPFAIPEFQGVTRRLVLINLASYFVLLLLGFVLPGTEAVAYRYFTFSASGFLKHGLFWQPITYSLIHPTMTGTLLELISLWFVVGFLENFHAPTWVMNLYVISVLGTAAAAAILYAVSVPLGFSVVEIPLYGCMGGIFGLMMAIAMVHGDTQFLLFFVIGIKARYMVAIYILIAVATLFSAQRMYAFAQLGGAVAGYFFVKLAPRRGFAFHLSESLYGLRNRYYRWKRRRAGRKFEVYMRSQGRDVRVDRNRSDDPNDRNRWN